MVAERSNWRFCLAFGRIRLVGCWRSVDEVVAKLTAGELERDVPRSRGVFRDPNAGAPLPAALDRRGDRRTEQQGGASIDGQSHRRSSSGSFATWQRCAGPRRGWRRCAAARRPLIFEVGLGQRLPLAVADDEAGAVHRAAPDALSRSTRAKRTAPMLPPAGSRRCTGNSSPTSTTRKSRTTD